MKAVENKYTTHHLGAPQDWDKAAHGECVTLPVAMAQDEHGTVWYSWWELTWRERFAILLGRPVRLCICASYHPPVMLDLQK